MATRTHRERSPRGTSASSISEALEKQPGSLSSSALIYLILPLLLLTALGAVTIRVLPDPDIWFHMALGREILDHGQFPRTEIFSFTSPGREWISSGWAASLLFYYVYKEAATAGLLWMTLAIVAAAHLNVYFTGVRKAGPAAGFLMLMQFAGILAAYLRYTPRPEIWSHLFLAAVISLLVSTVPHVSLVDRKPRPSGGISENDRPVAGSTVPKRLWALPFLFVLWGNLHAGFMVGFVPLALFGLWHITIWNQSRYRVHLFVLVPLALSGVAWLINPYGARLLALAGKIESIPHVKDKVYEWKPLFASGPLALPWPSYLGFMLLLAIVGVTVFLAGKRAFRDIPWWVPASAVVFAVLAIYQRRHAGIAAIALPALMIPYLRMLEQRLAELHAVPLGRTKRAAFATVAIAVFCASIAALQSNGVLGVGRGLFKASLHASILPVFSTQWLQANPPPGNIYNTYGAGGYLCYHLAPHTKVFIDGRLDSYDHKTWLDYLAIEDGTVSIDDAVKRYNLNTFILYTRDAFSNPEHLVFRLAARSDWIPVFYDDAYAVFVRKTPETTEYVSLHGLPNTNPFAPERVVRTLNSEALRPTLVAELQRTGMWPGSGGSYASALLSVARRKDGEQALAAQLQTTALTRDPANPLIRYILAQN